MNSTDIKFYHSGGGSNCDPMNDLGGSRSSCEMTEGLDMLFKTLTPKQSRAGAIDTNLPFPGVEQADYRCFYVKNTSSTDTLRNAKFYIDWERESGSYVDVGVKLINEIQTVEVTGTQPPNEGDYMILSLSSYGNFQVDYNINISEWQARFQNAIRGIDGLQDVIVTAAGSIGYPTDVVFTVNFVGQAENKKLSTMTVATNSLNLQTINVSEIQQGSPVGVVACTIPSITVAPACVSIFSYPARGNPVEVGDLRPGEQFPVWVRRTTPKNTRIHILDKIRFNVEGTFP